MAFVYGFGNNKNPYPKWNVTYKMFTIESNLNHIGSNESGLHFSHL